MQTENKFNEIPQEVLRFSLGQFELSDNGENAKSAPIKILAKGAEPIQHWFWGKVVHDFAGMKMKDRIPVDYIHNDSEIIGYLNKKEITPDGLLMSGALTPYKDNDRASEIVYKQKQGVPYEASINFAAPVKIEELDAGMSADVNGFKFDGPGIIIREWTLRGVAVCPYGADSNTESVVNFSDKSKTFKAEIINKSKGEEMKENKKELSAQAEGAVAETAPVEAAKTEEKKEETAEAKPAETKADAVEAKPETKEEKLSVSKAEFQKMLSEFGEKIACETMLSGGSYADAQAKAFAELKKENEELKKTISEKKNGEKPVVFSEAGNKKTAFVELIKSRK